MTTKAEAQQIMRLAIGRIFRLGSRPEQPGDIEQYAKARRAILDAADVLGIGPGYIPELPAIALMRHKARFGDSG